MSFNFDEKFELIVDFQWWRPVTGNRMGLFLLSCFAAEDPLNQGIIV